MLYFYPNGTIDEIKTIIISQLETLISLNGFMNDPIHNITFDGLTFSYTKSTYMNDYLVPSGGDWSFHPSGSIIIRGSENITIKNCLFENIGGNGIYINDYNRNLLIESNEMKWIGDSGIISYGNTELNDGTLGTQPRGNKIIKNLIHEVGIYTKQTSAYMQSKTSVYIYIYYIILANINRKEYNV